MTFPWSKKPPVKLVYKSFPMVRGMTLEIWRQREDLRVWLLKLWDEPNFQGLLDAVKNAAPRETNGEAGYLLGIREGYLRVLDNLLSATLPPPKAPPELEVTYSVPTGVDLEADQ